MDEAPFAREGFVSVHGARIWYGIADEDGDGSEGSMPLLVVHGGPGLPHDYLDPLRALAAGGRRVIFYDQLGCGNSDRPEDTGRYNLAYFVAELVAVRRALGVEVCHLLGHSFGGVICLDYLLAQHPAGIASLILSDTFASAAGVTAGVQRLRAALPIEVQATLMRHEAAGTTADAEYQAALAIHFNRKHVATVPPTPGMVRARERANPAVAEAVFGGSCFAPTGAFARWDVTARLAEIACPTLVIAGRDDQCVPELSEEMHRRIPDAALVIMEGCAHLPFVERPDEYRRIVADFLRAAEARTTPDRE